MLLLALASCNPGTDVDIGSLKVSVTTDGTNPDPDGYTIKIENRPGEPIGINGELTITELLPGSYPVSLSGLAPNCFMQGAGTVTVPVKAGEQAVATFTVNCPAANSYIRVTTQTTGIDPDPDGYLLKIGTAPARRVTPNGVINLSALAEGDLPIELTDVVSHCTPDPGNPTSVRAAAGQPNPMTLKVACTDITGVMQIAVATTGQDMQESGFLVTVDDEPITLDGANRATIRRLAGQHSVQLDTGSLNSNCTVSGNLGSETVTVGDTTEVTIAVACAALGRVVVSVTTTGQDIDSDGYSLYLSYDDYYTGWAYSLAIPANGSVTGPGMLPAPYTVSLGGIASNCRQSSVFPSPVTVASADAPLSITVVCNPARQLAFVTGVGAGTEIAVGSEASASYTRLTTNTVADSNPAWSPDGSRLAFTSARDGTGNPEIYTMNADGSDARRLTTTAGADYQPAWSSDGSRIAFVSERDGNAEIYVMGADGSAPVRLTTGTGVDAEPAWSPAGNRILFVSNRNTGSPAVYVMNADGSGVSRLTTSTMAEASPAWSPSGLLIALMRERQLQVMNANGSRQLLRNAYAGFSTSVSWGSDDRIAYTTYGYCDSYYGCGGAAIGILRPDESVATLPWDLSSEPAWRP